VNVGVLAIQGDFAAHARALRSAGHEPVLVRGGGDFARLDALVLPGGESTAMLHGIGRDGLDAPLRAFLGSGRPVLGTCAGAILLARSVSGPSQRSYGSLDVDIQRNAYGTQIDSFESAAEVDPDSPFAGLRCIFIRAPLITRTGAGVRVHARVNGAPVLVSAGPIWAATFHPELTSDARVVEAVFGRAGAHAASSSA
jgi:pyridoxal 5'-phosphate synthase pdxT subunit